MNLDMYLVRLEVGREERYFIFRLSTDAVTINQMEAINSPIMWTEA